ncbi:MAG: hypothetical protein ACXVB4_18165 [Pseudobdellovibrionaceae bacterium]
MNLANFSFSLLMVLAFWTSQARAEVWTAVNTWNEQWETSYAQWVEKNWTADFFSRESLPNGESNPYYGIRADCADTVYSMRLIYSFENKLPFAFQDPTAQGQLISHTMKRWDKYPDEYTRLKKFLTYIFDIVSTHSLPNDTFPVPVSRQWIHSGGVIRTTDINHHSWTIQEIQAIGVPHLIFNSTVGRQSGFGLQERISWPNPKWVFEGDFSAASNAGFRYWRPLEFINRPVWETPGYSEEQFSIPLEKWQKIVQKKLALRRETNNQMLRRLSQTACEALQDRTTAVNDGLNFLRSLPAEQCMSFEEYDTYSTPNRDQRLFDDIAALRRAYKDILKGKNSLPEDMKIQLNKVFPLIQKSVQSETENMQVSNMDEASWCPVEFSPGEKIDFAEAKRRLFAGQMSNNPLEEVEYRWGTSQGPSARAQACESWDVWKPDLKQAD